MTREDTGRKMLATGRKEDMLQLDEVLCRFDLSAERLQDSYNQLQQRIGRLNLELEGKNEQLKCNLEEKERSKKENKQ